MKKILNFKGIPVYVDSGVLDWRFISPQKMGAFDKEIHKYKAVGRIGIKIDKDSHKEIIEQLLCDPEIELF